MVAGGVTTPSEDIRGGRGDMWRRRLVHRFGTAACAHAPPGAATRNLSGDAMREGHRAESEGGDRVVPSSPRDHHAIGIPGPPRRQSASAAPEPVHLGRCSVGGVVARGVRRAQSHVRRRQAPGRAWRMIRAGPRSCSAHGATRAVVERLRRGRCAGERQRGTKHGAHCTRGGYGLHPWLGGERNTNSSLESSVLKRDRPPAAE